MSTSDYPLIINLPYDAIRYEGPKADLQSNPAVLTVIFIELIKWIEQSLHELFNWSNLYCKFTVLSPISPLRDDLPKVFLNNTFGVFGFKMFYASHFYTLAFLVYQ